MSKAGNNLNILRRLYARSFSYSVFALWLACKQIIRWVEQHTLTRSLFLFLSLSLSLWVHASSARSLTIFTHMIPTSLSLFSVFSVSLVCKNQEHDAHHYESGWWCLPFFGNVHTLFMTRPFAPQVNLSISLFCPDVCLSVSQSVWLSVSVSIICSLLYFFVTSSARYHNIVTLILCVEAVGFFRFRCWEPP